MTASQLKADHAFLTQRIAYLESCLSLLIDSVGSMAKTEHTLVDILDRTDLFSRRGFTVPQLDFQKTGKGEEAKP